MQKIKDINDDLGCRSYVDREDLSILLCLPSELPILCVLTHINIAELLVPS